jgi:asparagine synthase (glutamine-hydrolysing)
MAARGPDGKGERIWADSRVAFGHRHLSIIDLAEAGAQPMGSADGKLVITFNGKGQSVRSRSDTEVLLHLYAEKGEAVVHDLRRMFALAIWDAEHRTLFLARDPVGGY